MIRRESPLEVVLKGALSGLAGTAVLTVAMPRGAALVEQLGLGQGSPPDRARDQTARAMEQSTQQFAEKAATGLLEAEVEGGARRAAGQAVHWGYGAAWGALYGVVQSSLRPPHAVHGTIFGLAVATVASTLVPAMGLMPPPTRQPVGMSAMQLATHLLYGWATALTFRLLSKDA